MIAKGIIPSDIDTLKWQDYRAAETGMILYYDTDPVSEFPIREVPEEIPTSVSPEPNYETGTFGFYGCKYSKFRAYFTKNKLRYLFFMTRYAGVNPDYTEQLMVTGYYHIKQIADAQKLHIRYLQEYSCINEDFCMALRADIVHFVSAAEAFKITGEVLKSWDCTTRVTRQTKIILNKEQTGILVDYFKDKKNIADLYITETKRLQPDMPYDDEEETEEAEEE